MSKQQSTKQTEQQTHYIIATFSSKMPGNENEIPGDPSRHWEPIWLVNEGKRRADVIAGVLSEEFSGGEFEVEIYVDAEKNYKEKMQLTIREELLRRYENRNLQMDGLPFKMTQRAIRLHETYIIGEGDSPQSGPKAEGTETNEAPQAVKGADAGTNGEQKGQPQKKINKPKPEAIQAYQLHNSIEFQSKTLKEIAEIMNVQLNRKDIKPYMVFRYYGQVERWQKATGLPIASISTKPDENPTDPDKINMGNRRDGIAKRQQPKKITDESGLTAGR